MIQIRFAIAGYFVARIGIPQSSRLFLLADLSVNLFVARIKMILPGIILTVVLICCRILGVLISHLWNLADLTHIVNGIHVTAILILHQKIQSKGCDKTLRDDPFILLKQQIHNRHIGIGRHLIPDGINIIAHSIISFSSSRLLFEVLYFQKRFVPANRTQKLYSS